ncbi:MAG TPA: hypothetical protein VK791_10025 [bacterium]|jgi:hypothetical protein|nr:hypothetical protein [bacterium]
MKNLVFGIAVLFAATSSWAGVNAQPTQTHYSSKPALNPNLHQIHARFRQQKKEVKLQLKSGKITKEQAKNIQLSLVAARKQEVAFTGQNGNQDLTSTQQAQLNQSLDKNAQLLGEKP